jgi:CheY-like chemotaxis protein
MNTKRILIIDDEPTYTRMMKRLLETTGRYEVHTENISVRSVNRAMEVMPDLILLDVVMPGLDGGDVATRLRAEPKLRQIPVVFVTSLVAKKEARDTPTMSGGYRFIRKLANEEELLACIEGCVVPVQAPSPA